jgi:hypothetical protein
VDLDEFAKTSGYVPLYAKRRDFTPDEIQKVLKGRADGYSWDFIAQWLTTEQDLPISAASARAWFLAHHPETR